MPERPLPPDPASDLLTFLESVGRRSEAELYLRLFRNAPRESFAVIVTEAAVLRHARSSVVDACAFLGRLGLFAPIVVGMSNPAAAERAARDLENSARTLNPTIHSPATPDLAAVLTEDLRRERLPIVHLGPRQALSTEDRYRWLGDLLAQLDSRKVVVLRRRGGLGPRSGPLYLGDGQVIETHRGGIGIVNATTDLDGLRDLGVLADDELDLLEHLGGLVRRSDLRAVASVTSPLTMLQELFTQKGAGTLVRRGNVIECHDDYRRIDRPRLLGLLETTFGAPLTGAFFERPVERLFVERDYRGAAIIEPGAEGAAFLTKFAVEPVAQGEGMGRDLWRAVTRLHPAIYWRARMDNPVSSWYATLADGTMKHDDWRVFWRGVTPEGVPAVLRDATARPVDFERGAA